MSDTDVRQIRIQLLPTNAPAGELQWPLMVQDAVGQAEADVQADGFTASLERAADPADGSARGAELNDFLLGVASNAVSTFLIYAVQELVGRIQRQRHKLPTRYIVFEAGEHRLEIPADASVETVADQISSWATAASNAPVITISTTEPTQGE